jgi:hypothetical protein
MEEIKMNTAVLKNWDIHTNDDGFLAPELVRMFATGKIYEDGLGRFADGDEVRTSSIHGFDLRDGNLFAVTGSTRYLLNPEDINLDYLAALGPDVFDRWVSRAIAVAHKQKSV